MKFAADGPATRVAECQRQVRVTRFIESTLVEGNASLRDRPYGLLARDDGAAIFALCRRRAFRVGGGVGGGRAAQS